MKANENYISSPVQTAKKPENRKIFGLFPFYKIQFVSLVISPFA